VTTPDSIATSAGYFTHINNGSGVFIPQVSSTESDRSYGVALGDIDGDGDLDAYVANWGMSGQPNRVYLNDGSGVFSLTGSSTESDQSFG
jgi:hypothetical protein